MATYKEIGAIITDMIINAVKSGETLPWIKPWKGGVNPIAMGAVSYTTGRPYSFINQLMLGGSGEWVTFNKCRELGGSVKKGAKSRAVYFAKSVTKVDKDADGKDVVKTFPVFQKYLVFSIADCEGLAPKWTKDKPADVEPIVTTNDIPVAEDAVAKYVAESGITFINNISSNEAFYSPSADKVVVPNKEQFKYSNEYYSTTFHEFVHSTLKPYRCNRPQDEDGLKACFGNSVYAKEELVAELGSCMILASLGISTETTERNSTAYLQSWLKALKNDTSLIVTAASKAEKAVKFILGEVAEEKVAA